jgi:hypothetical protein
MVMGDFERDERDRHGERDDEQGDEHEDGRLVHKDSPNRENLYIHYTKDSCESLVNNERKRPFTRNTV